MRKKLITIFFAITILATSVIAVELLQDNNAKKSFSAITTDNISFANEKEKVKKGETEDLIVWESTDDSNNIIYTYEPKTEKGKDMTVYDILKSTEKLRNPEGKKALKFYEKEPKDDREKELFSAIKNAKKLSEEMNAVFIRLQDPDANLTKKEEEKLRSELEILNKEVQVYTDIMVA